MLFGNVMLFVKLPVRWEIAVMLGIVKRGSKGLLFHLFVLVGFIGTRGSLFVDGRMLLYCATLL